MYSIQRIREDGWRYARFSQLLVSYYRGYKMVIIVFVIHYNKPQCPY